MLPSIGYVSRNLQHIYSAVHVEGETSLVANLRGDYLYDSSRGCLGRIWELITYIFSRCFAAFKEVRLRSAIHKTVELFLMNKMKVDKLMQDAESQISKACNGELYNKKTTQEKHAIGLWRYHTGPFFELWNGPKRDKVRQVFEAYGRNSCDLMFDAEHKQLCDDLSLIYSLESAMLHAMPFAILRKLGHEELKLNASETDNLDMWIKELNTLPLMKDVKHVAAMHKVLRRIVKLFPGIPVDECPVEYARVILRLYQHGCRFLIQRDEEWVRQQEQLIKTGISQPEIKFGAELTPQHSETRIFEIVDSSEVMMLENSSVSLSVKVELTELLEKELKNFRGLSHGSFFAVDPEGKYARIERLYPCEGIKWKSKFKAMDASEVKLCDVWAVPLSDLVAVCSRVEKTIPFAFEHLQMDAKKNFKVSLDALSGYTIGQHHVSFNQIEDLIYKLSNENGVIYRYLANKCDLQDHRISQFYLEVIQETLQNRQFDVKAQYEKRTITDPKVLERANELNRCVIVMQADYMQQIEKDVKEADAASKKTAAVVTPLKSPQPPLQRSGTLKTQLPPSPDQIFINCCKEVGNSGLLAIYGNEQMRKQFVGAVVQRYLNPPKVNAGDSESCVIC